MSPNNASLKHQKSISDKINWNWEKQKKKQEQNPKLFEIGRKTAC